MCLSHYYCIYSRVNYNEPWFRDIKEHFRGWPNQDLKPPLILTYMCQCGFYIYSIAALLTWGTRRKDFSVMMSHHVVTVILIAYSYMARFFRIGAVTLALHDASDVFLEAAKVFKYYENELGASVCFGLFAISWFTLRLKHTICSWTSDLDTCYTRIVFHMIQRMTTSQKMMLKFFNVSLAKLLLI
ncbi:unnamed protein product [Fraxinus pennsylvanica]|uniref:TLC domain-containing protein n=1 Tax=Fraxinus pennsylvanica TaxID=56036 RepID=A0AAD2DVI2_9LAMI|nr:unnamed protein product [Fraxinus pennsylvanica]